MKEQNKNNNIAIAATVVFHVAVLLLLVFSYLHYKDIEMPDDIEPQDITFFGGEYVMLGDALQAPGDMPAASADDAASVNSGDNMDDAGAAGESVTTAVVAEDESPLQVRQEQHQSGPSQEELAEQERLKRQQETERRTDNKVKNAFSSSSSKGSGSAGSPNGNSDTGARSGVPGVTGLSAGYSLAAWGQPNSPSDGTVTVRVRVNSRGKVIEAKYHSGNGAAASNDAVRRSCVQASLASTFSVPLGTIDEAVGYITWRFE